MDLTIKDVSELLNTSEQTITQWIDSKQIPSYQIDNQWRFSRMEIEDWMINQGLPAQHEDNSSSKPSLYTFYRALNKGGIYYNIMGNSKEAVITHSMKAIVKTLEMDAEGITALLLDRERLMPTALNHGVGVPHTRDFILDKPYDILSIVYPEKAIDYGALDNKPVDILFFLLASSDKRHLQLLAKIALLCSDKESLAFLKTRPNKQNLMAFIKQWENQGSSSKKLQQV